MIRRPFLYRAFRIFYLKLKKDFLAKIKFKSNNLQNRKASSWSRERFFTF
jgi:hypothetical protein